MATKCVLLLCLVMCFSFVYYVEAQSVRTPCSSPWGPIPGTTCSVGRCEIGFFPVGACPNGGRCCIVGTFDGNHASPVSDGPRIVNGTNAKPGEIPYIVSLRYNNHHRCGGSILDETHVLTAAHCVIRLETGKFSIQYGVTKVSEFGNVINVKKIVYHNDYNHWRPYSNDIAVLTLNSPLTYSEFVQPVVLPEQGEAPPAGDTSILAGWGRPYTGGNLMKNLQRVDLLVYSDEDCKKAYKDVNAKYHVCSGVPQGGKGSCNGDSGGPLVADGKQIGLVSWALKPCTRKGYPGVYCRVSSYIDWINQQRK